MDILVGFLKSNIGGLVTGGIIAVAQLAIVYLWIERYVEKLQLRTEARKWQQARNELDATLMSLAHQLVHPLNHYTLQDEKEETAVGDLKRTGSGIARLKSLVELYELKGVRLAVAPEID